MYTCFVRRLIMQRLPCYSDWFNPRRFDCECYRDSCLPCKPHLFNSLSTPVDLQPLTVRDVLLVPYVWHTLKCNNSNLKVFLAWSPPCIPCSLPGLYSTFEISAVELCKQNCTPSMKNHTRSSHLFGLRFTTPSSPRTVPGCLSFPCRNLKVVVTILTRLYNHSSVFLRWHMAGELG